MDCTSARLLLAFRRPGGAAELAREDAADLDRHLAGCPACAALARRQDGFDLAVARAMRTVAVPAGLRDRLVADALARRGAEWRRTAARYTVAAAALVMLALTTAGIGLALRPSFDTEKPPAGYANLVEDPERSVRGWLESEGLPTTLPRDFNYALLDTAAGLDYEKIDGRYVPRVVFRIPPRPDRPGDRADFAKVYVVRKGQFELDSRKFRNTQNSFCNVIVVPDDGSGVGYVILFTTDTLDPFLKPRARDAARVGLVPRPARPAA
jgi:hypothetical protein